MPRSEATPKRTRCYLYTRVSTAMQVDAYSLDAQLARLEREAKYRGMDIADKFSDAGFSGKNVSGRPGFTRMLKRIQDGNPDGVSYVLVYKLSRFDRNAADVLNSLQLMQDYGVNLICVDDGIDSSKDAGKLVISVLSSVAEIELENIRTQTMAGRWQKAKEGKWNGGFAPYGYKLEGGKLLIEEDEAEVIRLIFEQYVKHDMGIRGIAIWLNDTGQKKKLRQNGTVEMFSDHFVKRVIDNPVYAGKIAYGRRRNEPIRGKRNEYHIVKQSEFDLYDGEHEAIIPEDTWYLVQEKRTRQGGRCEKRYDFDHAHQLSGILKCPLCGAGMLPNVSRKKKKDGTLYKTGYYYVCKHRKMYDGHPCTYRRQPPQDRINAEVEALVVEALQTPAFLEGIRKRLGETIDEDAIRVRIDALEAKKRQLAGAKMKLATRMDDLDIADPHYDAKYEDMQARLDAFYDCIAEVETNIGQEKARLSKVFRGKASMENAVQLMKYVQDQFPAMPDTVKKAFYRSVLDSVEIFENPLPDGRQVRAVHFKFPVLIEGETDVDWYADDVPDGWDSEAHDETVVEICRKK